MEKKISEWTFAVERLAMVATKKNPQAAFTGLSKSLQHQWTYLQRVIPDIGPLFAPLEEAISSLFLPAIFGDDVIDPTIRDITSLPVKFCGLGIPNPVSSSPSNLQNSQVSCSLLIQAVQCESVFRLVDHRNSVRASRQLQISH